MGLGLPNVGQFVAIVTTRPEHVILNYFPNKIQTQRRANWQEQDVLLGTKPLFYANRDARRLTLQEAILDKSRTRESIKPEIDALEHLQEETDEGAPPVLLASWGDERMVCVLEEVTIERTYFDSAGVPMRAQVNLSFLEVQEDRGSVDVDVRDAPLTASGRAGR